MASSIHIGNLISEVMVRRKINGNQLAELLNTTRGTVSKMRRKEQVSTEDLYRVSVALKYDFFSHYSKLLEKEAAETINDTTDTLILKNKINVLEATIATKDTLIELLRPQKNDEQTKHS